MSHRIIHLLVALLTVATLGALAEPAAAAGLSASLRTRIEGFIAERAGGPVDSISVPPLGDFELEGVDPGSVRIELSTRQRGPFDGAVAVSVVISNDEVVLKRGVVTARVETTTSVWVAARELSRGTRVMESDLRLEQVPARSVPKGAVGNLDEMVGLQLRRSLQEGAVLRTRYLEPVSLIERGQVVRIVLRGGGLQIVGKGRAVTDGAYGQQIKVVNTDSRREVTGRVEKDGSVYVDM